MKILTLILITIIIALSVGFYFDYTGMMTAGIKTKLLDKDGRNDFEKGTLHCFTTYKNGDKILVNGNKSEICVQTGYIDKAGTDSNIYFFEENKKIYLETDNSGYDSEWFIDYISIKDISSENKKIYLIQKWLKEGNFKLRIDNYVVSFLKKFSIKTCSLEDAETNGTVILSLNVNNDIISNNLPNSFGDYKYFKRGSIDYFYFSSIYSGFNLRGLKLENKKNKEDRWCYEYIISENLNTGEKHNYGTKQGSSYYKNWLIHGTGLIYSGVIASR